MSSEALVRTHSVGKSRRSWKDAGVEQSTEQSFGVVLRDYLLANDYVTGNLNPNWAKFCDDVEGVHYETLRKAVSGERAPGAGLMEAVAKTMGVEPEVFYEYRLMQAARMFDAREVGIEQALANLKKWAAAQ